MRPPPTPVLDSSETVADASQSIQQSPATVFLVRIHPTGWTTVNLELLRRLSSEGKSEMTLGSALPTERLPYLHPDYPLDVALRYVYKAPLVPVVNRADFRKLEGVISSEDVINKYRVVPREETY